MFAVIGEAMLDMVQPAAGGPYWPRPGGGPLNIAVGLSRLGHETQLLARLSTGTLGSPVRQYAESNGLDLSAVVDTDDLTSLAFATIDDDGKAAYTFYVEGTADWGWTSEELSSLSPAVRVLHAGSLATVVEPGATAIVELVQQLRATAGTLISFDPNIRSGLAGEHAAAVSRTERFVSLSHVVKASHEDVAWLYPGADVDTVLDRWLGLGPSLVVMTMGSAGCRAVTGTGHRLGMSGVRVDVVDTIGAGDAFVSGLLSALAGAAATTPATLATIDLSTTRRVLEQANLVAAITCQRQGADPPTQAELQAVRSQSTPGRSPRNDARPR